MAGLSEREKQAIQNFEMISKGESKIRIVLGSILFCFSLLGYFYGVSNATIISCGLLSFLLGAGIAVVRTGIESQWGCIVKGHWKPDGPKTRKAPTEFAIKKRKEFFANVFQSLFSGIILALVLQIITRLFVVDTGYNVEYLTADLLSCTYYGLGSLLLVFVLGAMA